MDRIRFGVWGLGRVGAQHAKFYSMEKDKFKLVAVCDIDEKKLKNSRAEYQCAGYTDSKAFLADPNMDLVVIATLSIDHTRHAAEALERGKYVLLDKPIAITDGELETLRQADKKYPGRLFILHNLRFEPGLETVQRIIESGLIGDINLAKLRRHHRSHYFRSDWQTLLEYGGGLLNNWGNHEIDHGVQLIGAHAVDVWSQLWHISSGGTGDDHVKIVFRGNNDRVVDIEISNNVTLPEPYCTVYGHRGSLVCDADLKEVHIKYIDPEYEMPEPRIEVSTDTYQNRLENDIPWREEKVPVKSVGNIWEYMDRKLIKHLYDAIEKDIPSPVKNGDAFETIRIIQEVKKQNPGFDWIVEPT